MFMEAINLGSIWVRSRSSELVSGKLWGWQKTSIELWYSPDFVSNF